jgi:hypothetical protein
MLVRAELKKAADKLGTLSQRMDQLEQPEPEELIYPPGQGPEEGPEGEELIDEEEPTNLLPGGELHTVAAKVNGHAMHAGDDDEPQMLQRSPLLPAGDPKQEIGTEPEMTLPTAENEE